MKINMDDDQSISDYDDVVPKTYSIYLGEDDKDLARWIEFRLESDDYYGPAHLFKKALKTLREEEREDDVL